MRQIARDDRQGPDGTWLFGRAMRLLVAMGRRAWRLAAAVAVFAAAADVGCAARSGPRARTAMAGRSGPGSSSRTGVPRTEARLGAGPLSKTPPAQAGVFSGGAALRGDCRAWVAAAAPKVAITPSAAMTVGVLSNRQGASLAKALWSRNVQARRDAVFALARWPETARRYAARLAARLKDKDAEVRRWTLWALVTSGVGSITQVVRIAKQLSPAHRADLAKNLVRLVRRFDDKDSQRAARFENALVRSSNGRRLVVSLAEAEAADPPDFVHTNAWSHLDEALQRALIRVERSRLRHCSGSLCQAKVLVALLALGVADGRVLAKAVALAAGAQPQQVQVLGIQTVARMCRNTLGATVRNGHARHQRSRSSVTVRPCRTVILGRFVRLAGTGKGRIRAALLHALFAMGASLDQPLIATRLVATLLADPEPPARAWPLCLALVRGGNEMVRLAAKRMDSDPSALVRLRAAMVLHRGTADPVEGLCPATMVLPDGQEP